MDVEELLSNYNIRVEAPDGWAAEIDRVDEKTRNVIVVIRPKRKGVPARQSYNASSEPPKAPDRL